MKSARFVALALGCVLSFAAISAPAQSSTNNSAPRPAAKAAPTPPVATVQSFDAFKSVPDRNIFNSRRYAGRQNDAPAPTRRDPVIESFSLLGTLDYPKGTVAFFEGTDASHRKAAKVDESIGGCKITGIEPNVVTIEANGKAIELKVGYMLRREDDGAWQMREAERQSDYSSGSSSSFGSGSSFGGSSSSRDSGNSSRNSRGGSSSSSFNRDPRSNSGSSSGGNSNPAETAQQRIREQDRNGDGKISRDEADSRLRPNFDLMDRNRDGFVDAEEYTAYYAARMGGGSSGNTFNSGGNSSSSGTFGGGSTSGSSSAPPSGSSSPGVGNESDLLKRLMEQRSRENR